MYLLTLRNAYMCTNPAFKTDQFGLERKGN
jgi:hypothetical protein